MKKAFPPYSFVPGRWPHPRRDEAGHSFGEPEHTPVPMQPGSWHRCSSYLRGIELFNRGYYWEAHEAWEGLWLAAKQVRADGQTDNGTMVEFFQGLIKLAAAGVKVRQGMPDAAEGLAASAAGHFQAAGSLGRTECIAGLALPRLIEFAESVADRSHELEVDANAPVQVVFETKLTANGKEQDRDPTS